MVGMVVKKELTRRVLQTQWMTLHIAEWCAYRGLSQAELAKRTGLSEGLISQLFARESNGSPDSLQKIAQALRIPIGYLFDVVPKEGGRWVLYWVPQEHLTTYHTMVSALGAKLGKIERD